MTPGCLAAPGVFLYGETDATDGPMGHTFSSNKEWRRMGEAKGAFILVILMEICAAPVQSMAAQTGFAG